MVGIMDRLPHPSAPGESNRAFVTPQLFDRIVASPRLLIAINTPRCSEIVEQFRQFAVRSGNSIYSWSPSHGITSLREGSLVVPSSTRLPDALRYVQNSLQYGIYLFPELSVAMQSSGYRMQVMGLLKQIGRGRGATVGHVRKLVIVDHQVHFSEGVDEWIEHFADEPSARRKLRLRDGRWVV